MDWKIYSEAVGSKELPEVRERLKNRPFVALKVFPTGTVTEEEIKSAPNITHSNWKVVFQNNEMSLAKITAGNFIYEYYCIKLEDGHILFFNAGLLTLTGKVEL